MGNFKSYRSHDICKKHQKTPKNEVFNVFLLKKNTGSTRRGTARVLRVSGPWIGTLPAQYPYPKPLRVSGTHDLHYIVAINAALIASQLKSIDQQDIMRLVGLYGGVPEVGLVELSSTPKKALADCPRPSTPWFLMF